MKLLFNLVLLLSMTVSQFATPISASTTLYQEGTTETPTTTVTPPLETATPAPSETPAPEPSGTATGSGGDPDRYKSNWFVTAFNNGCKLSGNGCSGPGWRPTDQGTTTYGLKAGSVEDFADSFASTILYNNNMKYASFMDVSRARMNIINVLIVYYH